MSNVEILSEMLSEKNRTKNVSNVTEDQVTQSITVDGVDVVNNVIPMHNPTVLENSNNSNDGEKILLEVNNDNILVNVDQFKVPSNNPALWIINDVTRDTISTCGISQNIKELDFSNSKRIYNNVIQGKKQVYFRYCSANFFYTVLISGEKVQKDYLAYSQCTGAIFCIPCKLFGANSAFATTGFLDRKRADNRISSHEQSPVHKSNTLTLKNRGTLTNRINSGLLDQINDEVHYWKNVLKRVVVVVKTLAIRGLAFREVLNKTNKTLQLVSTDLITVVQLYDSIIHYIQSARSRSTFLNYENSVKKLSGLSIYEENEKRKIKRKLQHSENRSNEVTLVGRESFIIKTYYIILDNLLCELQRRKSAYDKLAKKFSFFHNITQYSTQKICQCAKELCEVYPNDLNVNLASEVVQLQGHIKSIETTDNNPKTIQQLMLWTRMVQAQWLKFARENEINETLLKPSVSLFCLTHFAASCFDRFTHTTNLKWNAIPTIKIKRVKCAKILYPEIKIPIPVDEPLCIQSNSSTPADLTSRIKECSKVMIYEMCEPVVNDSPNRLRLKRTVSTLILIVWYDPRCLEDIKYFEQEILLIAQESWTIMS
ncbi:hypothetical protein QTP88_023774 [Uroleucon formosanum]